MAILVSGDFHNNVCRELDVIRKRRLNNVYGKEIYNKIKYHVILGDTGFLLDVFQKESLLFIENNYKELNERDFPVLCVMGNHEPIYGKDNLEEEDIGLGNNVIVVRKENPYICFLKRGYCYNIDNKKILVLGGGLSIDKESRIKNNTWWKKEYWSHDEKNNIFKYLKKENNFDYIFSHTAPQQIINKLSGLMDIHDEVAHLNDIIDSKIIFKEWFCGHLHKDIEYYDKKQKKNFNFLYRHTKIIDDHEVIYEKINI